MLEQLANDGIAYFNNRPPSGGNTIIAMGPPRSGTSMVITTLQALGVFIGDDPVRGTLEDRRLTLALERKNGNPKEVITDYNRHSVWAYKRPWAYEYIERKAHLFRRPRYILTFRDPIAIAKRNELSMGLQLAEQVKLAADRTAAVADFMLNTSRPTMAVSYEKVLSDPRKFTMALAAFCGIEANTEAITAASQKIENGPDAYLIATQTRFRKSKAS
ncbi:hypothetical protein L598_001200000100 [Mesorhizobium sp. J18]|uniref:sulfotransferase n=1 Tax=Mesorhizobium sp. J18 TaxID=935263 RepID=UPI00119B5933|nr:sulfotransferase [Mesorhizobium sp. J18]TWG99878.1 hypothetical protein L598_001200000100 [Mesorhizobium sp. J18]